MKNAEQPANPIEYKVFEKGIVVSHNVFLGLTKREYFAAMAMQGLCTDSNDFKPTHYNPTYDYGYPLLAEHAVKLADALLAELEKPTNG